MLGLRFKVVGWWACQGAAAAEEVAVGPVIRPVCVGVCVDGEAASPRLPHCTQADKLAPASQTDAPGNHTQYPLRAGVEAYR
jgi:hypothetical protein